MRQVRRRPPARASPGRLQLPTLTHNVSHRTRPLTQDPYGLLSREHPDTGPTRRHL